MKLTYFTYCEHGKSTQEQRLQLLIDVLLEEDYQNSPILEEKYCRYTYEYDCKSNKYPLQDKKVKNGETSTNVY